MAQARAPCASGGSAAAVRRGQLHRTPQTPFVSSPAYLPAQAAQSALQAHGEAAARILDITWVLFTGGAVIFVGVLALCAVAVLGPPPARDWLSRRSVVVGGGIAFPVVALTALLVYTFGVSAQLVRPQAGPAAARIHVSGELWWWRVRYLDAADGTLLETANEIHIPVGQPVDVELASGDVIHSFWLPSLAGKLDMLPGHTNRLRLQADTAGVYRGQCAEFCGAQHARMVLHVVAQEPGAFEQWLRDAQQPAAEPQAALARRGRVLFEQGRCGVCHAIRGTGADGTLGPDLTHVGSRLTLAAGTLPNGAGALAGWIADPQHAKPGARMPAYRRYSGEELRALAAYLEGLR